MNRCLFLLVACGGCQRHVPAGPSDAANPIASIAFAHGFSPEPVERTDAGTAAATFDGGDPALLAQSAPANGKSVGHTSVVFEVKLLSGVEICFKPESKRGRARYRGEIAAYRLAVALGLGNVIPAVHRTFEAGALAATLDSGARELFAKEAVVRDGKVRGAAMTWITKLEFLPLETPAWRARWGSWLGGAEIPEGERALAAQTSTMLVFDYLTGNWDRWSGANVGFDRSTGTVLFVDNDGAFFDPPPPGPLAAQWAMVARCARFSRALVSRMRKMDPIALADAIGEETPGTPLMAARVLAGVDERRVRVLAHVDDLVTKHGDAAVLVFP